MCVCVTVVIKEEKILFEGSGFGNGRSWVFRGEKGRNGVNTTLTHSILKKKRIKGKRF